MHITDNVLADWRDHALDFQKRLNQVVIGLDRVVELVTVAVFARGHVLLEGDVGVGKTTLLRAVAQGIGGAYERIEGTIDLLPGDLVYHTFINEQGRPAVEPGPLLKHGEQLSTFFFNEVNRARPQVHALLLRIMAERGVSAFNREHRFPHLQVFADRNRVEKEETFEIPSAARDRFLFELNVAAPQDPEQRKALMFDTRFHDTDTLIRSAVGQCLPFDRLNEIAAAIQERVAATDALRDYALHLWQATQTPNAFGVRLDGVDMDRLILAGASARGMSMLLRAARVVAWLDDRNYLTPEDLVGVFHECIAHRVFFQPVYEIRRENLVRPFTQEILRRVASP